MKPRTVRELIYWEYAKLVAEKMSGSRKSYAAVTYAFKEFIAERKTMSALLRENKLLVASEKACVYCGSVEPLQWEHVIPRSRGGPDTIDNLVLACRACNLSKATRDPYEWYGKDRRHEIPRVVVGKYLKLMYDRHEELGILDQPCEPDGARLSDLMAASGSDKST